MILAYLLLLTGLTISAVAIYYSVVGLTAIFSAAAIPIMIMGVSLEVAKLVCATWIKQYWTQVPRLMKTYMVTAVVLLMLITSMGIFGFLSKAHNDQNLVSGDVQSKIAIYDEKIRTARDNIEAGRKQLQQMDAAVDQVMGRSTDEKGADKAVAIRNGQKRDRAAIAKDIETNQKIISALNDEAAPIRAEVRKVEAEVGPIKYIAAFIYGVEPDATMLEKAVTWIIITIVVVFDPLAVIMLLASQMTFAWKRGKETDEEAHKRIEKELTETMQDLGIVDKPDNLVTRLKKRFRKPDNTPDFEGVKMPDGTWVQTGPAFDTPKEPEYEPDDGPLTDEQIDQINQMAAKYTTHAETELPEPEIQIELNPKEAKQEPVVEITPPPVPETAVPVKIEPEPVPEAVPGKNRGVNMSKMFTGIAADNQTVPGKASRSSFGNEYPTNPEKGDVYLRTDYLPNRLFKFNGFKWIEVDKDQTDVYAYNELYIQHLINEIDSGRYDPEQLTDVERQQIAEYLEKNA
jgi:hypothetical protein